MKNHHYIIERFVNGRWLRSVTMPDEYTSIKIAKRIYARRVIRGILRYRLVEIVTYREHTVTSEI
jgi:hypothetical protein